MDKRCRACGITKPLDAFHRDHRKPGGRNSICRVCRSAANQDGSHENLAKTLLARDQAAELADEILAALPARASEVAPNARRQDALALLSLEGRAYYDWRDQRWHPGDGASVPMRPEPGKPPRRLVERKERRPWT